MRKGKSGPAGGSTPETTSERFKAARTALGLGQIALARDLGVSQSNISPWEHGQTPVPNTVLLALQALYGVSHDWLVEGRGAMFLGRGSGGAQPEITQVPLVDSVKAWDKEGRFNPTRSIQRLPQVTSQLEAYAKACGGGTPADFVLVRSVGEGMSPMIPSGSVVLVISVKEARVTVPIGGICLVRKSPSDSDGRFKLLGPFTRASTVELQSINPAFGPISVEVSRRDLSGWVLGRACAFHRSLLGPQCDDW